MTTTDNLYDRAREVLRERGRCTGNLVDTTGAVCLIGAVKVAANGHVSNFEPYTEPANAVVAAVIREQFPDRVWPRKGDAMTPPAVVDVTTIYDFNDTEKTTDDYVDLVLDKAARRLDEQGAQ